MLRASYVSYNLDFLFEARTSRETMRQKPTYFIKIWDDAEPEVFGIGECALFRGLSFDDVSNYEEVLHGVCENINEATPESLRKYPSILFGVETAMLDLENGGNRVPFKSDWLNGETPILINGLVWMGSIEQMKARVAEKLNEGFRCIKFKIGGEDFEQEYNLLKEIRKTHPATELEIRLDANGAFTPGNALERLKRLALLEIHSIEQPIRQGQWSEMASICENSPIAIALDEELIGITEPEKKYEMLNTVKPKYIILKPSLCGGFSGANEWISIARLLNIGWWATSALESNIGLNAIGQWVSTLEVAMPQGLGTGSLYSNNIESPLECKGEKLYHNPNRKWLLPKLDWVL